MRATVLVSDLLIYIPALIFFIRAWHVSRSRRSQVSLIISGYKYWTASLTVWSNLGFCFFDAIITTFTYPY